VRWKLDGQLRVAAHQKSDDALKVCEVVLHKNENGTASSSSETVDTMLTPFASTAWQSILASRRSNATEGAAALGGCHPRRRPLLRWPPAAGASQAAL